MVAATDLSGSEEDANALISADAVVDCNDHILAPLDATDGIRC
jgi:hypothetical protein